MAHGQYACERVNGSLAVGLISVYVFIPCCCQHGLQYLLLLLHFLQAGMVLVTATDGKNPSEPTEISFEHLDIGGGAFLYDGWTRRSPSEPRNAL